MKKYLINVDIKELHDKGSKDPVRKISEESLFIKVKYKGVTFGDGYICSDDEPLLVAASYLDEIIKELLEDADK